MKLTPENKAHVDALSHYQLLERIRFAPIGDVWMQGETGAYWMEQYAIKKAENPAQAVGDSKALGW
jgi:hypothetical protein